MPEFVIEKAMPGLGELGPDDRNQTARASCSALHGVGPGVEWVQSYLTHDKVYCVYRAPSEEILREHIERLGLPPVLSICEVHNIIRPATPKG